MLLWKREWMYLFKLGFSFLLEIYPELGLLDNMAALFFIFKGTPYYFSTATPKLIFPPTVSDSFVFPHPFQCLIFVDFLMIYGYSDLCEVIPHCEFDLHFSNSVSKHLSICLLAICMSSLKKHLFRSYANYLIELFVVFLDTELYKLSIYFG